MNLITRTALAGGAILALLAGSFTLSSGTGQASACTTQTVDPATAGKVAAVAGYSGTQLTNAAHIINAATALGLDTAGQTLGVMTAMGESSLRVLDHGDTAGPDSRGLFQQRDKWGTLAQRMDAEQSATLFFTKLKTITGWEQLAPSAAAHKVQGNADPDHYTRYYQPATAVVQALAATTRGTGCGISGDKIELAQNLVTAADEGRLKGLTPDHIKEIRWIAQGQTVPDCDIDVRILQIITIALNTFHRIGVSDINRKCTGQILGGGTKSSHWINGGGGAVDFYSLAATPTTGADGNAIRLIGALDAVVQAKARIGQKQCRAKADVRLALQHFAEFDDTCNHLHVDIAYV
ncbi:hypothetical protein [Schumannella sp. 10F1B-5-1]|uniref:hypothetical protein n=1 Tax=Schumannella sp. 10F1B-5-1 TaxID=2590780 RepID=UPI0011321B18|nr:hypothetical protein [Schumannella sp. 10F1B-5-1]TPW78399.1 hypothetical protein FJ658_00910 [Schumannella sp. 10F1B-5-1]